MALTTRIRRCSQTLEMMIPKTLFPIFLVSCCPYMFYGLALD